MQIKEEVKQKKKTNEVSNVFRKGKQLQRVFF